MATSPAILVRAAFGVCLLLLLTDARPLIDVLSEQWTAKRTDADDGAAASLASQIGVAVDVRFENEEEFSTVKVAKSTRTLELECVVVTSGVSATIHWLHNGQRVIQGPSDLSVVGEAAMFEQAGGGGGGGGSEGPDVKTVSKLRVGCMDRSKVGKYTCVADTPSRRITVTRQVALAADDDGSDGQCSDREATQTRIYMYKKSHDDSSGKTVQLFCRVSGYPRPRVHWYYAGGPRRVKLESGSKFEILDNGDLVIRNLDADDFGDYVCEASNGASRSSVLTNVYVYA